MTSPLSSKIVHVSKSVGLVSSGKHIPSASMFIHGSLGGEVVGKHTPHLLNAVHFAVSVGSGAIVLAHVVELRLLVEVGVGTYCEVLDSLEVGESVVSTGDGLRGPHETPVV